MKNGFHERLGKKHFFLFITTLRFIAELLVKYRVRQIPFLENALNKTTEDFHKFLFLFESTILRLILENNFIQMTGLAGHAVVYTIGPIFKHIMNCVQLYFSNGFQNVVL